VGFNMENFAERKLKLLQSIRDLTKAIDDATDWFIASFREKDPRKKVIARYFADRKEKELARLAKEEYERYSK